MSSNTRKMTPNDPRSANPLLPDVSGRDHAHGKVNAYRIGYQDAVTVTASMSSHGDTAGRRALDSLRAGDAKPYRALTRRRNPIGD